MTVPQVVVLGDANVDMVIRLPDRTSGALDLTQSVPQLYGGGSAANVAVALARLGLMVTFVGSVGDDSYGRWVRDDLAREGVDTQGMVTIREAFTSMVMALIEPDGERLVVVWPPQGGAHIHLRAEDLDSAVIASASWLHTSGMCLRASPVREGILHAMRLARGAGTPVSLDLNLRLELWGLDNKARETVQRAIGLSDVIFGSAHEEIAPLAGLDSVEAAAGALCDGQRLVVARLGADGALAVGTDGTCRVPAFQTPIVDTLGAGDAFDAGFIAARLAGCDIRGALQWGNAVAALKIGRPGARGTPSRVEAEQLLAQSCG